MIKISVCVNKFFGAVNNTKEEYRFLARKLRLSALNISVDNYNVCLGGTEKIV